MIAPCSGVQPDPSTLIDKNHVGIQHLRHVWWFYVYLLSIDISPKADKQLDDPEGLSPAGGSVQRSPPIPPHPWARVHIFPEQKSDQVNIFLLHCHVQCCRTLGKNTI